MTKPPNYQAYGVYRAFPATSPTTNPAFRSVPGWDPDVLIARTDTVFNAVNSADTAGFYWLTHSTTNNGLRLSDAGTGLTEIVAVSKYVNGNVSVQNLNGLDHRIGHSAGNPVLDARGRPKKKFFPGPHTVNFPLDHQKP